MQGKAGKQKCRKQKSLLLSHEPRNPHRPSDQDHAFWQVQRTIALRDSRRIFGMDAWKGLSRREARYVAQHTL